MQLNIIRHPSIPFYDYVRFGPELPHHRHLEALIELRHAKVIARNVLKGKPYWLASPVYALNRQQIAAIHINAERILAS